MYKSLADAIRDAEAQQISLAKLALETEAKDQGRTVEDIRAALLRALNVMRGAVARGMTGDLYSASGLVGGDAAKLRTGPQDYHSTEQGEIDGPAEITSLRFVCTEHEPVIAGRYTDRFLMAQAYGTWQAMEDAHRWVIMITLSKAETATKDIKSLFAQVNAQLAQR